MPTIAKIGVNQVLESIAKIIGYWIIVLFVAIVAFDTLKWLGFRVPVVRQILIFLSEKYQARKERKEKERIESEAFWRNYHQQQHIQTENKGIKTEDAIAAAACLNMMRSNRPGGDANVFSRKFPFLK